MTPSYEHLAAQVAVYRRGNLDYTRCLCRGTELLVTGQPEEVVRQALLVYLMQAGGLYPRVIDLRAEFNDIDIAVLKPHSDERFRPLPKPLAVIEVKRTGVDLRSHQNQLFSYLTANGSDTGFLYSGRELFAYEPDGQGGWSESRLTSLAQLDSALLAAARRPDVHLDTFHRAAVGCVASFLSLVDSFGRYTLHRIAFALKSVPEPITGCCFRVEGDRVHYDSYGNYTRKQRLSFRLNEFVRLDSILY